MLEDTRTPEQKEGDLRTVEWLRCYVGPLGPHTRMSYRLANAADEIERLRAEVAELKAQR